MIDFIDKTSEQDGTPINRENLMAIQGFEPVTSKYSDDGRTITYTYENGNVLTITFKDDGSITETFVGEKTIIKHTKFSSLGKEVSLL